MNIFAAALSMLFYYLPLNAQEIEIPRFFSPRERLEDSDISRVTRLRFLTTIDFPPFNYIDGSGNLAGYHIDLARSLCMELKLTDHCQIEAVEWADLTPRLKRGEAETIIAGLAMTDETLADFSFSRPYMYFPARFISSVGKADETSLMSLLETTEVGVIKNTAHEKMLTAWFPDSKSRIFDDYETLVKELQEKGLNLAFGDGMRFSLWLASRESAGCCHFVGGAYYSTDYLGDGLRLAVSSQNKILTPAFNYALNNLEQKGKLTELYLRYFPVGFY